MMLSGALLLLLAAGSCVKCETLTQPASVTVQPGHPLTISCTVSYNIKAGPGFWTHWVRQPARKGLEWIGRDCDGCTMLIKDSLKSKFSINAVSSSNTVTLTGQNMQPGDTAVYYCARSGSYGYFDYWGKGTQVTVTSATSTAPTVFPVMPCNSDSGNTVTLACLATGFTPSSVSFKWTQNDTALTDFIQYPPVLKNDVYSGVSQIRVRREDWDQRHPFKCRVEHASGNKEVDFVKPNVVYQLPNLTMMTSEESEQVTFSCLANDFSPNVYDFKWLKDNVEITNTNFEFTTPSKSVKTAGGTKYSAASFLTLATETLRDDTKLTCKFNMGRGGKQQSKNSTHEYRPSYKCPSSEISSDDISMKITPPTLEDMLYRRVGQVTCEVKVKEARKVFSVSWMDESGKVLMNNTDSGVPVNGGHYVLTLQVTYDEWNEGIKRICELGHEDLITGPMKKVYERKNDISSQKGPSVFMLPPLKQAREDTVTLTCYIKDFYPEELYVMWLIDDKESTHEFNTTNSVKTNGAYYAYSHLTVPLSEWEVPETVYSCLVYHEAIDLNKTIVRSITQHSSEQTTMVNLNMRVPDMCKAQ